MNEIKPLTSMRGIFALWVLAYHIEFFSGMPRGEPIMSYGFLGVEFFFLLSGFILANAYGSTFADRWELKSYRHYLVRRIRRIFPLHWAVLAVVALSATILAPAPPLWPLLGEITLTHMWLGGVRRINGPDWSLSTEFAANIVLPILTVLTLKRTDLGRFLAITTVIAATAGLLISASGNGWSLDAIQTPPAMVRCVCEFAIGMLIYRWHRSLAFVSSDTALSIVAISVVALVVARSNDLVIALLMAVGLFGLAGNTGRFGACLSIRPLHYLGKISFSVYLVQQPVLRLIQWMIGDLPPASGRYWIFALAATASVIAVSHLTYSYIEIRFKNPRRSPTRNLAGESESGVAPLAEATS
jgi:peptidoglycan/LPS O-acetylase OafA/YrhL